MEWRTIYVIFCTTELLVTNIFLDSSMVERTAVNRDLVGSSPVTSISYADVAHFLTIDEE